MIPLKQDENYQIGIYLKDEIAKTPLFHLSSASRILAARASLENGLGMK